MIWLSGRNENEKEKEKKKKKKMKMKMKMKKNMKMPGGVIQWHGHGEYGLTQTGCAV